ncbi:hypothetical protein NLJ89_g9360 [Agrocybe chaxingu]|uniref:RNI-like protein n=1 Tax=Agrocybe chaxingu TaxID=84603 RepID=A0A9W8JT79_9AGAR|nr:hypothetical protein NLJ89_g9360 [Agrocybe chaxingu]
MLKSLRIHPRPGPLSDNDDLTFNTGADANSILHPKNVFLSRISPNSVGIAWNHVVRADIGGITAFDYLSLLATSPKLISLRICALKDNEGQGTQSFGPHPVTHSALEILNLTTIAQNIDALLNHITLPSLQKLVANSLTTGLTSMIARSAPPLTDLTIGNAESSGEVISLLKMMPNLNDLRLLDTQIGTWFFQYLASTSTFSTSPSEDEDERFLPNLSSLKIRGQLTLLWSYVEDLFGLIPKLNGQDVDGQMQIRRPLTKLSIEIKPVVPMVVGYYKTEVVDEETLRQLRTAGISLEIYDYQGNFLTGTNGGESGKEGQR